MLLKDYITSKWLHDNFQIALTAAKQKAFWCHSYFVKSVSLHLKCRFMHDHMIISLHFKICMPNGYSKVLLLNHHNTTAEKLLKNSKWVEKKFWCLNITKVRKFRWSLNFAFRSVVLKIKSNLGAATTRWTSFLRLSRCQILKLY